MSDEIKLSPMKWGTCPNCNCDMDLHNPVQLVIRDTATNDNFTLLRLACSVCNYSLFEKFVDLQDYR